MHQEGWRNMEEILLVGCEGGLMVSSRIGSPLFASKVIRICLEMILDNWMVSWRQWKESRTRFLIGRKKCSFAQMFPNPSSPADPPTQINPQPPHLQGCLKGLWNGDEVNILSIP